MVTSLPGVSVLLLQYFYLRETSRYLLDRVGGREALEELEFVAELNKCTVPAVHRAR